MKINEKHLCDFAVGKAHVDKEGFLNKRGEVNRAYQRRWFVLKGNLLFYFDRPSDREPVGVVILDNCSVSPIEADEDYAFQLSFTGSGVRTYVLSASSQEEMEEWLLALTCANYDYVRSAVLQLQRQLDEINSARVSSDSRLGNPTPTWDHGRVLEEATAVSATLTDSDFSANSLLVDLSETPVGARRPRTFEEMHHDFGLLIQQNKALACSSNVPH